jgi:hypothetical protein
MGLGRMTSINYSHGPAQNQTTSWLVHSQSIFGAKMNHMQLGFTKLTMARTWEKPPPSPL